MIPILSLVIVATVAALAMYFLNNARVEADARERRTRTELYSVLGQSEAVTLSISDERPTAQIRYIDDAQALKIQRTRGVDNGS